MIDRINSSLKNGLTSYPTYAPTAATPLRHELPSHRASLRRLRHLEAAPKGTSPTQRFINAHPLFAINEVLNRYGMQPKDLALFKKILNAENEQFLGYQAGSSTVRLFQDMLSIIVKDILQIPIKDDFVFTRVPGDPTFHYEKADDFLKEMGQDILPLGWDNLPHIRQHILSLNMNLYQSYDAPWDLTPRYFLENQTWTHANVREIIKPFLASLGLSGEEVDKLWDKALDLLPHDRGYILQFFDESKNYAFAKEHTYIAHSGGKPHFRYPHHEILFDKSASHFPQIRMVMDNHSTLNPNSSLSIKRYDGMTEQQREQYTAALRTQLKKLPFDENKVKAVRETLLKLWEC